MNWNGPCKNTNPKYTEILSLAEMLSHANLSYSLDKIYDGYRVSYPNSNNMAVDAVQHWASYGEKENLIEILFHDKRFPGCTECDASVEGYLTAQEVFNRIVKYHNTVENDDGGDK